MKKILYLLGIGAVVGSCTSPIVPEGDANLVGVVVAAGPGLWEHGRQDEPFQIHVKADPQEECGIIFNVNSSTRVIDSRGPRAQEASAAILVEGARVGVWFGVVLDTCPGQSVAEVVERVE